MSKACAIVLGGKNVNSTGLIRSLGLAGFDVTFASRTSRIESKYTTDYLRLPASMEKWLPVLKAYIINKQNVAIFPSDDEGAFFLDEHYDILTKLAIIPHAHGHLRDLADKTQMAILAQNLGLMVPRYELIACNDWQGRYFDMPVILKPSSGVSGSKGDIRICHNEREYQDAMCMYSGKGYRSILQQQLLKAPDQYEVGIIGISLQDGRVILPGTIRKVRSYPPGRGSTSYARYENGLPVEERVLSELVRKSGYVGLFDIEMMMSGGKAWFIEINYRNGQYGYIATAAGYNLAANWFRSMLGEEIDVPKGIREITYINERDDYLHVRAGEVSRKQWMKEFHDASAYGMFCKGDQRPFIRQFVKIPDRVVIAFDRITSRLKDLLIKEEWNIAIRPRGEHLLFETNGTQAPFTVLKNTFRYWAADPFILSVANKEYLFFEMYDRFKAKGVIGYREIKGTHIGRMKLAFEAEKHLSFPFVFQKDGGFYMLPESSKSRELPLLKATDFPMKWEKMENHANDRRFVDSVLFSKAGKIYLFTHEIDEKYAFDTLDVYYKENDSWKAHSDNPVVTGAERSRLGGSIFVYHGKTYRVAQDCSESYGKQLQFSEIVELTPESYREAVTKTVMIKDITCVKQDHYNGVHTYNFSDRYEVIDLRNQGHIRGGNIVNLALRVANRLSRRM